MPAAISAPTIPPAEVPAIPWKSYPASESAVYEPTSAMPLTPPPSRIRSASIACTPGFGSVGDDHGLGPAGGIGRDGRQAEVGGQLHPLALADRRRLLRGPGQDWKGVGW